MTRRQALERWFVGLLLLDIMVLMSAIWVGDAGAQTVAAVPAPADYSWVWVVLVLGALVAVVVLARHYFPGQSAKAETAAKADLASAIANLHAWLLQQRSKEQPTQPATEVTAPEPIAQGYSGQPGPLTIQCSGDAGTDLAAFQTAYFAKPAG